MIKHDRNEVIKKLDGRRVIASVSGGKDSAALSLYLKELEIEHDRVFQDTGWEHPRLYDYLRGELTRVIGPIVEIRSKKYPNGMVDLVRGRRMFPSRKFRVCTQELKVFPARDYIYEAQNVHGDVVNAIGIRHEESQARADALEWEWSDAFDCEVWRPLITWTEQDVIDIHKRHGLMPNPLYLAGALRVGCWPCIFSRKDEIRMVAETTPERIDLIRALELEVQEMARARYAAKGETFESLGYYRPAFFPAQGALRNPKLGKNGQPVPIDEIVAWSKTPTRGHEPEPFDDPNRGCMRWGVCETLPPLAEVEPPARDACLRPSPSAVDSGGDIFAELDDGDIFARI